jgi:choline monooxygenase
MIEWYPHVLDRFVRDSAGSAARRRISSSIYYPEEIALFEREFIEAERAAYKKPRAEDDEIAERMDAGRRALMTRGESQVGPYQSPMEDRHAALPRVPAPPTGRDLNGNASWE